MGNVKHAFVAHSDSDAGGVVFAGPTGVLELPDNAGDPLAVAWKNLNLGTVAEDGLTVMYSRSSKKIKDFDGATYITVQDDFADGFKAKFLDVDNLNLLRVVYGTDNVDTEAATGAHGEQITIYHAPEQLPFLQTVCSLRSGKKRKVYAGEIVQVSEIAEIKDVYNDATNYEVTFDVLRGSDGKFLKEFRDDGEKLVPTSWVVTISGSPTGGTFPLTVTKDASSSTASGIAYNATTSAVDTALEALATVGAGNATVTGTAGTTYNVTLAQGGVLSTAGGSFTGGSSPSISVAPA